MEGIPKIKEIAIEKGLKLSWVAEKSNITPSMLTHIISGIRKPHINTKLQIARVLEVNVDEL